MHVLLLEPDRIMARCIQSALEKKQIKTLLANTATEAMSIADSHTPDAVICELTLPAHSGTEFIYEFRTYTDWQNVPLIVYSSMKIPDRVQKSRDWQLLNVHKFLYKPHSNLALLVDEVESFDSL